MTRFMLNKAILGLLTLHGTPRGHTRAVEYMLTWLLVGWGITVLLPGDVMRGPTTKIFLGIATEMTWGFIAVSIGGGRLIALVINGAWRRSPLLRFAGASLGLMWWVGLGTVYWIAVSRGDPPFPNLSIYPIFVFFEAYSCFRCGQDAASQDSFGWSSRSLETGGHG